jgi:hypothetical protein
MQSLGLSESTPRSEHRLKSLFWPRVRYSEDIDLLGTQGYWACAILAAFTLLTGLTLRSGPLSLLDGLYFYLAGVGIRRTSRFAAISVFLIYLLSVIAAMKIAHTGGVLSIFFLALLLSNIRGTWLAKQLLTEQIPQQHGPAARPPMSIFSDVLPRLVWPIGRWVYYGLTILMFIGTAVLLLRSPTNPTQ